MKRHFSGPRFKHLWDRSISNLTKGELHWLGMILSLESDPRVLLIDEYGVHLTDDMEQEFRSQLKRMNRSLGTTIIISSHSESLVKKFASVIIFLDNGHISKIRSSSSRHGRPGGSDRRRKNSNYRTYRFNKCGHEQEIRTGNIRNNQIRCHQCLQNRLNSEAKAVGLTLIGAGRNKHYRTYCFDECGHEQEIQLIGEFIEKEL